MRHVCRDAAVRQGENPPPASRTAPRCKARAAGNISVFPAARSGSALAAVRKLGCGVSIGSFGQRPESLRLLQQLQATVVKIDGELGRRAAADTAHAASVGAIARACRSMRIFIAESVETMQSRKMLSSAGVDCAQGPAVRPIVEELVELTYGPASQGRCAARAAGRP